MLFFEVDSMWSIRPFGIWCVVRDNIKQRKLEGKAA